MIRIIVKEVFTYPEGGKDGECFTTFDVDLPEVEKYLKAPVSYCRRSIIGVEIIPDVRMDTIKEARP